MNYKDINAYPEMNEKIAELLALSDKPSILYAEELIEILQAQLAKSQRREKAAEEDIKHIIFDYSDEPCDLCYEVCANYNGTCVSDTLAGFTDKCNGFEWRGPQEPEDEK